MPPTRRGAGCSARSRGPTRSPPNRGCTEEAQCGPCRPGEWSAENAQGFLQYGGCAAPVLRRRPNQHWRWVLRLLALLYVVLVVSVVIRVFQSPSIRIPSPFELSPVGLVGTLAGLSGLIVSGWLILQIGHALMEIGKG